MTSLPRTLFRPARNALARSTTTASKARGLGLRNKWIVSARGMATVGNAPPMEPQKERRREMAVGELEGAVFTIEPIRRVGEDDKTMRARLVYQSRKRGILETDLLLSTFADAYLPTMTRDQMADYDLFLDENDWDIYYWATQEEPSASSSSSSSTTSPSSSTTTSTTAAEIDTSSPSYGSAAEIETATATAESTSTTTSTGGLPLQGEEADAKGSADPVPPTPYAGEWAQTVGTFKPAYRPVPARWRDSELLALLRAHVRARAGAKGGMAFMPALKS
ncbi:Flavinator of succinate dehydrogenase-domain-containing protein [Nemania abortiva]|nr:Flavinator of succinate dehydrogenase-domain-containing protein [Nemania abortiva]